jgi:hypothetical protein
LGNRAHARFFWGLSAVYGLNLYLFDGLGQGIRAFNQAVRDVAGFDLTIPLALANVAIFVLLLRAKGWGYAATVPSGVPRSVQ